MWACDWSSERKLDFMFSIEYRLMYIVYSTYIRWLCFFSVENWLDQQNNLRLCLVSCYVCVYDVKRLCIDIYVSFLHNYLLPEFIFIFKVKKKYQSVTMQIIRIGFRNYGVKFLIWSQTLSLLFISLLSKNQKYLTIIPTNNGLQISFFKPKRLDT